MDKHLNYMKKLFLIPVLGLLAAACAHDASFDDGNQPNGAEEPENRQVLSVNIVSVGAGTRADRLFQDGTAAENQVDNVRFYFFTASGAPASVKFNPSEENSKEGTYQSFYDWSPSAAEQTTPSDADKNVEKVLTATIVIDTEKNDKVPYSMVAVINPSEAYIGENGENLSLDELNAVLRTYNTEELTRSGKFVMSNSRYLNREGAEVEAVPVVSHIYTLESAALNDPVEIYVERVVSRLDFAVSMTAVSGMDGVYDTGVSYDAVDDFAQEGLDYEGNIYVKFLGWNVTSTPDKSRLVKKIDSSWGELLFGWNDEPWNDYFRYRSYWAVNPEDVQFSYGNFGQALSDEVNPDNLPYESSGNTANARPFSEKTVYMQENAASFGGDGSEEPYNNTKVIIAAQLVESDGETPVTLAEWGFNLYTVKGLKTLFAQELDVYKRTSSNGKYTYAKITPDDITFVTAGTIKPEINTPEAKGRYYVYPQLKEDENVTWTFSRVDGTEPVSYEAANGMVEQIGPVKIWNDGYTYYFFNIGHLGKPGYPGENGVVRNHIYDATVSMLTGLGTPVYDPNETIYPEKPDGGSSMIAAKINVLTWRIVKKSITLDW